MSGGYEAWREEVGTEVTDESPSRESGIGSVLDAGPSHRYANGDLLQAKLTVSHPQNEYEREAERVADEVMRTGAGSGDEQRRVAVRDHTSSVTAASEPSQNRSVTPDRGGGLEARIRSVRGGGQSLSEDVRSEFEARMGYDFGDVTVHTGGQADAVARSINARAFTLGSDVVFRSGEYRPDTSEGKRLLAHELTHVVQQNGAIRNDTVVPERAPGGAPQVQRTTSTMLIQRKCVRRGKWKHEYDGCSLPKSVMGINIREATVDKDNPTGKVPFAKGQKSDLPCDKHDECYQTCRSERKEDGTWEINWSHKKFCDDQMKTRMERECQEAGNPEAPAMLGGWGPAIDCMTYATAYHKGLRSSAYLTDSFENRQIEVCMCEAGTVEGDAGAGAAWEGESTGGTGGTTGAGKEKPTGGTGGTTGAGKKPSQQPSPSSAEFETYEIQSGDTLSKVAKEHGVEGGWSTLWNYRDNRAVIGDNPHLIHPGTVIKVPKGPTEGDRKEKTGSSGGPGATGSQAENDVSFSGDPGVIASLYFPTGVSKLDSSDIETLNQLNATLMDNVSNILFNPTYSTFTFEFFGYADKQKFVEGSEVRNLALSGTRARNVKNAFEGLEAYRKHLAQSNLCDGTRHVAKGATGPEPKQTSDAELAQYRRVDIKLVPHKKGKKKEEEKEEKEDNGESDGGSKEIPEEGLPLENMTTLEMIGIDSLKDLWDLANTSLRDLPVMIIKKSLKEWSSALAVNELAYKAAGYSYGTVDVLVDDGSPPTPGSGGRNTFDEYPGKFIEGFWEGSGDLRTQLGKLGGQTVDERTEFKRKRRQIQESHDSKEKIKARVTREFESLSGDAKAYMAMKEMVESEGNVPAGAVSEALNTVWEDQREVQSIGYQTSWDSRRLLWPGPGWENTW